VDVPSTSLAASISLAPSSYSNYNQEWYFKMRAYRYPCQQFHCFVVTRRLLRASPHMRIALSQITNLEAHNCSLHQYDWPFSLRPYLPTSSVRLRVVHETVSRHLKCVVLLHSFAEQLPRLASFESYPMFQRSTEYEVNKRIGTEYINPPTFIPAIGLTVI
jgi:hypothetical protein